MLARTVHRSLIIIIIIGLIAIGCAQSTVKKQPPTDCPKMGHRASQFNESRNVFQTNLTKRDAQTYMPSESDRYYQCPRENDPNQFTRCCGFNQCCQAIEIAFFPIVEKGFLPMITEHNAPYVILVTVVLACLLVVATLTICCFVSFCPLYNSCRVRYYRDEASCTNKLSEIINTSLMPGEQPIGNTVVIARKFDSDDVDARTVVNGKQFIESTKITKNTNEFAV